MTSQYPTTSIIIVNYNGREVLTECLDSLAVLDYPQNKLEILVIDNGSTDDSVQVVKQKYQGVRVIELTENLGFTGANNIGIKQATGEYIVLLNNDTQVEPGWLQELVRSARPKQVGIVTSKLLLSVPYLEVKILSSTVQQSELDGSINFIPKGVLIENIYPEHAIADSEIWYESGFEEKKVVNTVTMRWCSAENTLYLPVRAAEQTFTFTFHGYPTKNAEPVTVSVVIAGKVVLKSQVAATEVKQKKIKILKDAVKDSLFWVVQNAGTEVLKSGHGKDRGSMLRLIEMNPQEFYEPDSAFFNKECQLVAGCGAAMLIKRKVIEQVGELDRNYFMYYEDVEFSLRAWKMGWHVVYSPGARVYHKHRTTTGKTESLFLTHMTERNHLFLVTQHFPVRTVVFEYCYFVRHLLISILKATIYRFTRWEVYAHWRMLSTGRLDACLDYHRVLPRLLYNRWWRRQRYLRTNTTLMKHLY